MPSEVPCPGEGSRSGPGYLLQQWVESGGLAGCRRSPAGAVPGRFQGSAAPGDGARGGLSVLRRARPGTGSRGVPSRLLGGARLRGQRSFGRGSGRPGGPHAAVAGRAGPRRAGPGTEGPEGVAGPALPAQIRRGRPRGTARHQPGRQPRPRRARGAVGGRGSRGGGPVPVGLRDLVTLPG